ncbi:hypothetical protein Droror1_Dr00023745 [Drosera rotundifolia]
MTLEAILNEYVQLKRQKEMMDQQRHQLVQERNVAICIEDTNESDDDDDLIQVSWQFGDPSHTPKISVPVPTMVNREPVNFSSPAASSLPPRKRSRNITEETRARKKPHNPLSSHQLSDKDKDLSVVSTSTNLTNVQMNAHRSLTKMSSATTAQSTQPPKSGSSCPRSSFFSEQQVHFNPGRSHSLR